MKITIPLSKWYAKGNVNVRSENYRARMLTMKNEQCCLGHASNERTTANMVGLLSPRAVAYDKKNWMVDLFEPSIRQGNSDLAELAIELNDASFEWYDQPLSVRMGNLITVFAEGGDELEFICDVN